MYKQRLYRMRKEMFSTTLVSQGNSMENMYIYSLSMKMLSFGRLLLLFLGFDKNRQLKKSYNEEYMYIPVNIIIGPLVVLFGISGTKYPRSELWWGKGRYGEGGGCRYNYAVIMYISIWNLLLIVDTYVLRYMLCYYQKQLRNTPCCPVVIAQCIPLITISRIIQCGGQARVRWDKIIRHLTYIYQVKQRVHFNRQNYGWKKAKN